MRSTPRPKRPAPPEHRPRKPVPPAWSAAVGLAALALYLALAPKVSGDQDASELTLALATGGVPHPTGYPLYALLGHGFCVAAHALGATWPYAANAWSAVGGGLAIGLFHALACRMVPGTSGPGRGTRFTVALVPSALAGLNPVWTMSAALAEVHSWHLAWVSGISLLYLSSLRALGARQPWTDRTLVAVAAAWGATCGIGLAHHVTGVLFAVPLSVLLVAALVRARRWRPRLALVSLAAALAPLASYAFVGYRALHPALFQWPMLEPSWGSVLRHVTGGGYAGYFGHFAPADLQLQFLAADIYPFLFPGMVALLALAWRAHPAERLALWGLLAAMAAQTAYTFNYGVPDPAPYFLPPVWMGLLAVPLIHAGLHDRRTTRAVLAVTATLGVVALSVPWIRAAADRRQAFGEIDEHLHGLWGAIPFERGIVLWPRDMYCRLKEYQIFAGEKPDLFVTSPNLLTFDAPRRDFERRFGFDPLAGLRLAPGTLDLIPENINRQTKLPVVVVDRLGFSTSILPKPASGP